MIHFGKELLELLPTLVSAHVFLHICSPRNCIRQLRVVVCVWVCVCLCVRLSCDTCLYSIQRVASSCVSNSTKAKPREAPKIGQRKETKNTEKYRYQCGLSCVGQVLAIVDDVNCDVVVGHVAMVQRWASVVDRLVVSQPVFVAGGESMMRRSHETYQTQRPSLPHLGYPQILANTNFVGSDRKNRKYSITCLAFADQPNGFGLQAVLDEITGDLRANASGSDTILASRYRQDTDSRRTLTSYSLM